MDIMTDATAQGGAATPKQEALRVPIVKRIALMILPLFMAACATPGSVLSEDVGSIRAGVGAAREQARLSFVAANKLAQEQAIDRKIGLPEPTLRETDFPTPISTADAAAWSNAFGILDAYGAALQSLVDPERAEATGDAIGELATSLNGPAINARIPASLSAVFQTFGQELVQARAEKSATAIMRKTDPAFNEVLSAMASAIGGSPADRDSLQFVVESNWTNSVLANLETRYGGLAPTSPDRRKVVQDYVAAIGARDAQLANLSQLQQSLIALSQAHAAAARGRPGDALFWVGRINGWLDDIKRRTEATEKNGGSK
jgi:hypothetical protein